MSQSRSITRTVSTDMSLCISTVAKFAGILVLTSFVAHAFSRPDDGSKVVGKIEDVQKEIGLYKKGVGFIFIKTPNIDCPGVKVIDGILHLAPATSVGLIWGDDGVARSIPIFKDQGTYTIVASEDLETEQEGVFHLNINSK
ncbi:TPA: hypothetical protein NKO30_006569 [Pseudomonas aeruginosa]|nr:hypothetical protein [Pseudomonas aeruginosa]